MLFPPRPREISLPLWTVACTMAMNGYDVPRTKDIFGIHRAKPTEHCQILHLHLHTAFAVCYVKGVRKRGESRKACTCDSRDGSRYVLFAVEHIRRYASCVVSPVERAL